jgi:hypothetical protein
MERKMLEFLKGPATVIGIICLVIAGVMWFMLEKPVLAVIVGVAGDGLLTFAGVGQFAN